MSENTSLFVVEEILRGTVTGVMIEWFVVVIDRWVDIDTV